MTIVSNVEALRKRRGLTQLGLANKVDVTETTIANWERTRSGVEWFHRLNNLCRELRCTPKELAELESGSLEMLRKRQNLTQRELAKRVGVTDNTIANWEKSSTQWFSRLHKLCEALDCTPQELVQYCSESEDVQNKSMQPVTSFRSIPTSVQSSRKSDSAHDN